MSVMGWVSELEQLGNSLSLVGVVLAAVGLGAAWWFFYVPRRIQVSATASLPMFWMDPAKLPFTINATNINTRQVKIKKVGFETVGRKSGSYELTVDSGLFKNDKLLISEGDNTELHFDAFTIAHDMADGLKRFNLPHDATAFKIWLYITHGRRIQVEVDADLTTRILDRIAVLSRSQQ